MLTNVTIVTVPIRKRGQKAFFEIKIPEDAERVIGVEAGITDLAGIAPAGIIGRQVAGIIRLQAEGSANLCYSTQPYIGISDLDKAMPGFSPVQVAWQQFPYTASYNREPETIDIRTNTVYGSYTDVYGKRISTDLSYTAVLYLWTVRKEN